MFDSCDPNMSNLLRPTNFAHWGIGQVEGSSRSPAGRERFDMIPAGWWLFLVWHHKVDPKVHFVPSFSRFWRCLRYFEIVIQKFMQARGELEALTAEEKAALEVWCNMVQSVSNRFSSTKIGGKWWSTNGSDPCQASCCCYAVAGATSGEAPDSLEAWSSQHYTGLSGLVFCHPRHTKRIPKLWPFEEWKALVAHIGDFSPPGWVSHMASHCLMGNVGMAILTSPANDCGCPNWAPQHWVLSGASSGVRRTAFFERSSVSWWNLATFNTKILQNRKAYSKLMFFFLQNSSSLPNISAIFHHRATPNSPGDVNWSLPPNLARNFLLPNEVLSHQVPWRRTLGWLIYGPYVFVGSLIQQTFQLVDINSFDCWIFSWLKIGVC